ncbi:extracellular solute-binding protein [Candidatus Igneacidithiobacillus taiwanensis]|uniref:extracellular solute-binding protein n=1 Tax=Candidatus Igneacidithiobacillus taiwanensis TaxID=1945924 RepID=UPI00289E7329|nr:extracellular solute-binding protein [Candidatus Igneacidithiobacillus taiwanensis]MCE5359739.1 extracellular solute-binding protein [Acidithiobacillus sp.]
MQFSRKHRIALALSVCLALPAAAQAEHLFVAFAGSMGNVMNLHLGPAFAKANHVEFRGDGQGAYGLAHLIAGHQLTPDVFVSITPGPIEVLMKAGLVKKAYPVASTQMCIAYSPNGPFAKDFKDGKMPWYKILQQPGATFGRTDPKTDPQGQNIVFVMQLAEKYYHQPGLAQKILGPVENPQQIFTEMSLLARLKAGQIAASSGYLSAVKSLHLPYVKLPVEINLSDPNYKKSWYDKASFQLKLDGRDKTVTSQPLVFYAAVPTTAPNPKLGEAFIKFMQSPEGQKMFRDDGYSAPKGEPLG